MVRIRRHISALFMPLPWVMAHVLITTWACEDEPTVINSVVLGGGAYVQITNRQEAGEPLDSTSLAALNNDFFSLEIWASGDTLPAGVTESPSLFMISNDQGDKEISIRRPAGDSSMIFILLGESYIGRYDIPGCNWFDPDVFTQIVFTYDGSTTRVYGNGQELGSRSMVVDVDIGTNDALIGADWDIPNDPSSLANFWYGAIDEVRLWTKVLPASEMQFRYKNPDKLTKNYSPTGLDELIGLWRFNSKGNDGDLVLDGSGKGNDAVLRANGGSIAFTSDGS